MISLEGVSYSYPGAACPAVDGVNLTVDRGEFVAIMGRNASGKSTLARLMNGLLIPTAGRVSVDGLDTGNKVVLKELRKKIGLLFSDPDNQLISNLVEEEVAFGPENLGLTPQQIRYRVDTALKKVAMGDYLKYPPYLLSGGQKQRVCIAGILAMQPEYMVLDEPTSMLDPDGRRQVMETLLHLHRSENIALVWLTHSLAEACQANRIVVLDAGRVVLQGPPGQIISRSQSLNELGLEPLEITRLVSRLQQKGLSLPDHIESVETLVDALCRLR